MIYNIYAFEKFYWSIAHHYYYTPTSIKYVLNSLKYKFEIVPEQRYDISNHMTWMMEGKPGGQNKFFKEFGLEFDQTYRQRLKDTWQCDTIFFYIWKK